MAKASSSKIAPPRDDSDSESSYTSSSSDVSEDEFGEELTPALDAAILQTLGKIKRREGVYEGEAVLQEALKEAEAKAGSMGVKALQRAVAEKPFLLADHHRKALLEDGGVEENEDGFAPEPLTNVQEQRMLREGALNAFKSLAADSDDEDDDAGFVPKARGKDDGDKDREDEEYRRFLLEMGGGEEEVRRILGMSDQTAGSSQAEEPEVEQGGKEEKKKKKKSKKDASESETVGRQRMEKKEKADDDFLMNYILNRGWIDRSEKHVPTYDEVVAPVKDDDEEEQGESSHPWGSLEEDEFDEKAEEFETAYNFRYEEPGASSIIAHPRDIPSLVRRADDTRKTKRQARAERKAAERAAAEEETRRLKGKKRREMEAQVEALKRELGEDMDWTALEKVLDGEWDEEEWERVVGTMLSEAAAKEDDEKPSWDDMEDDGYGQEVDGMVDDLDMGEPSGDFAYEDVPFEDEDDEGPVNMDADFVHEEPKKKRSKKDKKDKKGKEPEVEIDPSLSIAERAGKVKQTLDEYKALDHEDMIGDVATRFKYTRSAPVDLGLTPVEILLATDAELNALAGMKHLAPYRRGGFGKAGMGLGRRIRDLKTDLRSRRWGDEEGAEASRVEKARVKGSGSNADGMGKKRKWGEGEGVAPREGGETKSTPHGANGSAAGNGPKKRMGKKQRMKAKLAEEAALNGGVGEEKVDLGGLAVVDTVGDGAAAASGDAVADGEGSGKKKRKKNKKKSGLGAE